ncbi:MAG: hypothetical protein MHM6MM_004752 [Cercozoa sp. M6MM]
MSQGFSFAVQQLSPAPDSDRYYINPFLREEKTAKFAKQSLENRAVIDPQSEQKLRQRFAEVFERLLCGTDLLPTRRFVLHNLSTVSPEARKTSDFNQVLKGWPVYNGAAGVALALAQVCESNETWVHNVLIEKTRKPDIRRAKQEVLRLSSAVIKAAIHRSRKSRHDISLLCGHVGVWAVAAYIANRRVQFEDDVEKYTTRKDMCVTHVLSVGSDTESAAYLSQEFELLYGRSGYLSALLFLKRRGLLQKLPRCVHTITERIVRAGKRTAAHWQRHWVGDARDSLLPLFPIMYEWHDRLYLGAAHGVVGIAAMVAATATSEVDDSTSVDSGTKKILSVCARTLIATKTVTERSSKNPNVPSSLNAIAHHGHPHAFPLVQFCHGAPGTSVAAAIISQAIRDAGGVMGSTTDEMSRHLRQLSQWQRALCDVVWKRGVLRKGVSLCHGTSGNALAMLIGAREADDVPRGVWRAVHFALLAPSFEIEDDLQSESSVVGSGGDVGEHRTTSTKDDFSLFEGFAGELEMLRQLLTLPLREVHFPLFPS